jgi:hypothetical protein
VTQGGGHTVTQGGGWHEYSTRHILQPRKLCSLQRTLSKIPAEAELVEAATILNASMATTNFRISVSSFASISGRCRASGWAVDRPQAKQLCLIPAGLQVTIQE